MYDKERGLYIAHAQSSQTSTNESAQNTSQELVPNSNDGKLAIVGKMANRHGLIAGATGTGKTVTLQVMAETFCQAGVPCFMADMKGDLSGIAKAGSISGFIEKRMKEFGMADDGASIPAFQGCPVRFYDVFGEQGHPIRATISQMGPQLLSRLLGLNDTQDGVLNIIFRIADDRGLLILDLKDLRAMLDYVSKHSKEYTSTYGNISAATVGAIQRALLQLENQGANQFFGEPSFDINDLLAVEGGKGVMSVLAADKLMMQPKLYSTFLLWMISELYSTLPEVGDQEMPKLVFFFDEAHTLFEDTPKALTDKIEQVIRLIRSKGVGIYFISQLPTDIPDNILGQLGNRVQHALRAYTPRDQKAVKVAAETFRPNPSFKTEEAITQLETGEALVSLLDEKGAPGIVQRAKILFPLSQIGALTPAERAEVMSHSAVGKKYDTPVDRESAYEMLVNECEAQSDTTQNEKTTKGCSQQQSETKKGQSETKKKAKTGIGGKVFKSVLTAVTATLGTIVGTAVTNKVTGKESKSKTTAGEKIIKNATSSATRTLTRELSRDILGNLIKK